MLLLAAVAADVAVSSTTRAKPAPIEFKLDDQTEGGHRLTTLGVKVRLNEGKPLEVLVWGSGGAIAGSIAGPLGALVGGGAGALCGLLYSVIVVPHNGPGKDARPARAPPSR